jgi:hypothetical protein
MPDQTTVLGYPVCGANQLMLQRATVQPSATAKLQTRLDSGTLDSAWN